MGGFGGVADRLNAYNVYVGDPSRITSDLARYRDVTPEAIKAGAVRYLDGRPRVSLTVRRRQSASVPVIDRSVPPASAPSRAFAAPTPVELRLDCGVPLLVIPRRDLPIAAMSCVLKAGASAHGPDRGGLASLVANLLDEGTTTRTGPQIAEAAESLGTHLSTTAGWDGSHVGMQCLSPHLDASLDLVFDLLLNPTFPPDDVARVKAQTLAGLQADRESADARASRAFLSALFPSAHPYRVPVDGTEETVAGLSRDDLARFHAGRYEPGRAAIVVAGDVDPDEIARRLDARLSGWRPSGEAPDIVPPIDGPGRPRMILLDRPGAAQAVIRVGHIGTDRLDPDYNALLLFNQILGGQFTSRLNAKLREGMGVTYGIRSGFDFRRGTGPFAISASLQSDRLAESLDAIRIEVSALMTDRPPTRTELADARRALIEGQARHFETPSSLVARYAGLFLHGLPPDHHAGFAERLDAVTLDGMFHAVRRRVRPDRLVAVVVADAASVGPVEGWRGSDGRRSSGWGKEIRRSPPNDDGLVGWAEAHPTG